MNIYRSLVIAICLFSTSGYAADSGKIEEQLAEIGTIGNEEIMVVQRKYTRKAWRHELTPITFGGIPFGTIRRTLIGGMNYTLHLSDQFALEAFNFTYSKNFFSSFTDDINQNKASGSNPLQNDIKPDFQKLLYFMTAGMQYTPIYGKLSTFSRWIAYIEPYIGFGAGIAKTEASSYFTFYPAVGIRVFFREWFSMRLELRDYIYTEKYIARTAAAEEASATRHNYAVGLSFSFWLPKMPG